MSLENAITALTAAVEANTAALIGAAKPKAEKAEPAKEAAPEVEKAAPAKEKKAGKVKAEEKALTLADVQSIVEESMENLSTYLGGGDANDEKAKDVVRGLVKKHGAAKLAKLAPSSFKPFLADLEDAVSAVLTSDTGAGGGNEEEEESEDEV